MKRYRPNSYYLRRFVRHRSWWDIDWPLIGMGALNAAIWIVTIVGIVWIMLDASGAAS